jgi:O-antigen/teichoic acid export membrane protein
MRNLAKLSVYTLVGFLGAGVNFLLMPYLSHFIKPGEYGILSMVNSYVTILIPLVGLVAAGLISVDYFKIKDKAEFASLFSSVQVIPLVPAVFFLLINLLFPGPIAALFEIPVEKSYWLSLSVLVALLTIYTETLLAFTITEQRPGVFALFNIGKLVLEVGLTLWFVTGINMSWEGRLLSWLITNIIFFGVSFYYFHKRGLLTTNITRRYIMAGISFGLPLILHTLGKFVINQSDRVFIAKMVSIDEAGIYNIGYQVGMVMLIFVNAISNFIYPFISERLENPTEAGEKQIVKISYQVIGLSLLSLVLLTIATPTFFAWLVDRSYAQATQYVFWVALSYFFWGIYLVFSSYIFYAKNTKFLAWLSLLNILLNAGLNYILILNFGAIGAAYATCISFFVISIIVAYKANRLYPMPWFILFIKK